MTAIDVINREAWFKELGSEFTFPDKYLVLAIETSGLRPADDLIISYGWVSVDGGKTSSGEEVIDWLRFAEEQGDEEGARALEERLRALADHMHSKNFEWPFTPEYLREHGEDPSDQLGKLHDLLTETIANDGLVVVHSGRFVRPFLYKALDMVGIDPRRYEMELSVYETGTADKGSRCTPPEFPAEYYGDIQTMFRHIDDLVAQGVYWSLPFCIKEYGLAEGENDDSFRHSPVYKAIAIQHLFEIHRELANG